MQGCGVRARRPSSRSKHAQTSCGGCQIHVLDRRAFEPVRASVELVAEFRRQNPATFAWRQPPYEYEHERMPIDLLSGSNRLRATVDAGEDVGALVAAWQPEAETFARTRERFLLYS